MIESEENFMEVEPLGVELAWKVIKLWMESAGRDLNNYQWRVVANAIQDCSLPIFLKLVTIEYDCLIDKLTGPRNRTFYKKSFYKY